LLSALQGVRRPMANVEIYLRGMGGMMSIAITLVLAWTLADVGRMLGAPQYVTAALADGLAPALLPGLVFCVGGIISFATGSSWGTFAILMPLTIPAAHALGAPLAVCIAAVLSGGLFGDHSSPISETTILSATGAGTPQYEHFRTQVPYALANGLLALTGFIVAGWWVSFWVLPVLILGQTVLWLALARSRRMDPSPPVPAA
ncbi:MAG: Na+/H+ antiporter NhaC family protein, partial [Pseudomonadota bacterium]